jgi:hypothetical protein
MNVMMMEGAWDDMEVLHGVLYGAVGDIYLGMVSGGGSLDTNLLADRTRKE